MTAPRMELLKRKIARGRYHQSDGVHDQKPTDAFSPEILARAARHREKLIAEGKLDPKTKQLKKR